MKKEMFVFTLVFLVLLMSACASETQIVPMPTDTPAETQIPLTSTTEYTPTPKPTSTPIPTRTVTPIPRWVTDFAQPILKAIENQAPRFQDDFSDPNSGWQIGRVNEVDPYAQATPPDPGQHFVGERGYVDGEYFTLGEAYSCIGSGHNPNIGAYLDFVAEFDARFVSGEDGSWQIHFHRNDIGFYSLGLETKFKEVTFGKCGPQTASTCKGLAIYKGSEINGGDEWNHMLLIVRDTKMAAYINGKPILYTQDLNAADEYKMGRFTLGVCNFGITDMEVRWDGLKIWDISNLP